MVARSCIRSSCPRTVTRRCSPRWLQWARHPSRTLHAQSRKIKSCQCGIDELVIPTRLQRKAMYAFCFWSWRLGHRGNLASFACTYHAAALHVAIVRNDPSAATMLIETGAGPRTANACRSAGVEATPPAGCACDRDVSFTIVAGDACAIEASDAISARKATRLNALAR
jgi:hypothetical protein